MPVEIKELIIRATVGDERQAAEGAGKDGARALASAERGLSPADLDRIVDACVKRVLRILKKSQEK